MQGMQAYVRQGWIARSHHGRNQNHTMPWHYQFVQAKQFNATTRSALQPTTIVIKKCI